MKNVLIAVVFGLLLVGCSGNDDQNGTDDEVSNNDCQAVSSLFVRGVKLSQFDLEFTTSGSVLRYNVEYGESGFVNGQGVLLENISLFDPIEANFKGNTSYELYVISVCQDGTTLNSERTSFETNSCTIPTNFLTFPITNTFASVSWEDLEFVNNYEVEYGLSGFTLGSGIKQNVFEAEISLVNLEAGTEYDIYVRTNCGGEFGEYSQVHTFQTDFNCTKPGTFVVTGFSDDHVTFFWQTLGESTWQFEYGLFGFEIGTGTFETTSVRPYRIENLQSNTTYQFYLRAVCSDGGFSDRASLVVTTD